MNTQTRAVLLVVCAGVAVLGLCLTRDGEREALPYRSTLAVENDTTRARQASPLHHHHDVDPVMENRVPDSLDSEHMAPLESAGARQASPLQGPNPDRADAVLQVGDSAYPVRWDAQAGTGAALLPATAQGQAMRIDGRTVVVTSQRVVYAREGTPPLHAVRFRVKAQ